MGIWTTEEVADHLGLTVDEVYASRRRSEYPGNLGIRRGKRLVFDEDRVKAGPQLEPEVTTDTLEAILWELQAHTQLLRRLTQEVRLTRQPTTPQEEPNE